jgi:hypothetical protein
MKTKTTTDLWGLPMVERTVPRKACDMARKKATAKAYYERNREKILLQCKAYVKANRTRRNAYQNAWCKANRDKVKIYQKAWRIANREKRHARRKIWRMANLDKERAAALKRKYNLSLEQFDKIFDAQGRKCAICGTKESGKSAWHIDHCGKAGHVRGILCRFCNNAIGLMHHSPRILAAAQRYLSKEVIFNQP